MKYGPFVTCRFLIGGIKAIYRADIACFDAVLGNNNGNKHAFEHMTRFIMFQQKVYDLEAALGVGTR